MSSTLGTCAYTAEKKIKEHHKTAFLRDGEWVHELPERLKRGFQFSKLYLPIGWESWAIICKAFLEVYKEPLKMRAWMNIYLGLEYDPPGSQPDWKRLKARAEPYQYFSVPGKAYFLCCGVDTQDDRLVVVIRGWGPNQESWLIWYGEIYGDPDQDAVWRQLDQILNRAYYDESGFPHHIKLCGIDSGGHKTQSVYAFCRARIGQCRALIGSRTNWAAIIKKPNGVDIDWKGQKITNGVKLYSIGVDTAKQIIYDRLDSEDTAARYHFYQGLPDQYYKELTALKLAEIYHDGFVKVKFVKTFSDDHALDAETYCYAMAILAGLPQVDWKQYEIQATQKQKPKKDKKLSIKSNDNTSNRTGGRRKSW